MSVERIWDGRVTGHTGDYGYDENWTPINLRCSTYKWTASGFGTGEFYLNLLAGGDPGVDRPENVQLAGTTVVEGTVSSLAAGTWGWGDADSLGFNTIYVRLADGADPDSKASGEVTSTDIPNAADDVTFPAGSASVTLGLDQSGVAIGAFKTEAGYTGTIATVTAFLQIKPDSVTLNGTGAVYLDIGAEAITPTVLSTASASGASSGLTLRGSAMTGVDVRSGKVKLVGSTVTNVDVRAGGELRIPTGNTITDINNVGGVIYCDVAVSGDISNSDNGSITFEGSGALSGTLTGTSGTVVCNNSGTIDVLYAYGATFDFTGSRTARTVSLVDLLSGGKVLYDPNVVTITALTSKNALVLEAK